MPYRVSIGYFNKMPSVDDIALKYEAIIRACYNCERGEHNADTDIFQSLHAYWIDVIGTQQEDPSYSMKLLTYNKQAKIVIDSLQSALSNAERNDLAGLLDSDKDSIAYFDSIVYSLGVIVGKLF